MSLTQAEFDQFRVLAAKALRCPVPFLDLSMSQDPRVVKGKVGVFGGPVYEADQSTRRIAISIRVPDTKTDRDGDPLCEDGKPWFRADGNVLCTTCTQEYRRHPEAAGFPWLHRTCNGDLVKL